MLERRAALAVDATATSPKAGAVETSKAAADHVKKDEEAGAPAAARPKGRTVRRGAARQRKRKREADAKAADASSASTSTPAPVGEPVDGAASGAVDVVMGERRPTPSKQPRPTETLADGGSVPVLRWRAAAALLSPSTHMPLLSLQ